LYLYIFNGKLDINVAMKQKKLRYAKIWEINGFRIHIELYDSLIIIKDECGNTMSISKKNRLPLILNLKGNYEPF